MSAFTQPGIEVVCETANVTQWTFSVSTLVYVSLSRWYMLFQSFHLISLLYSSVLDILFQSSPISFSFVSTVLSVSNFERGSDLDLYTRERYDQNAFSVLSCVSWILDRNSSHLFDFYLAISIFTSHVITHNSTLVSSFISHLFFFR
jgi:hypothetical protein